jgi:hypothetical protein
MREAHIKREEPRYRIEIYDNGELVDYIYVDIIEIHFPDLYVYRD